MKPITLHPISVFAGLVLATLAFFASGAAQQPIVARHVPPDVQVVGQIPAEWWTYAELTWPGAVPVPYTVPLDRRFVVTLFVPPAGGLILANGVNAFPKLEGTRMSEDTHGTRVVYEPGTVFELSASGHIGRLWGYLEPL